MRALHAFPGVSLLVAIISLAACLLGACTSPPDPQILEVSVYSTPGKPHALFDLARPSESITARVDAGAYVLIVGINYPQPGGTAYFELQATLTEDEWQTLVRLVVDQKLLEFEPQDAPGEIIDYGVQGFTLVTATGNVVQEWYEYIENPAAPMALQAYLADLVRLKIPSAHLNYL